ncbi:MAG: SHOCT domain-containing protein [Bacteroidales bacterium]|nr:SHOCT domain-containing protein [Bacteroidales bacterium]
MEQDQSALSFFVIFLISLFLIIALCYWENRTFKRSHPEYHGKILWTLIVFPTYFLVFSVEGVLNNLIFNIISIECTSATAQKIIGAISVVVYAVLWFNIRKLVQNFVSSYEKQLKRLILFLYGYQVLSSLILFIVSLNDEIYQLVYSDQSKNSNIIFILGLGVYALMYYFSIRKIDRLSGNTSANNRKKEETIQTPPNDIIEKLTDLKKLYDAGVIDQEEFEQMKKNIINK